MNTRTFFIINTIIALPFGVGSVLAPNLFISLFGASLEPAGALMMQFGGAWLIGIGLLTWLIRNEMKTQVRRHITTALLVMYIVGFIVALMGQLNGVLNALGWLVVGINAFLALSYAYTLFIPQDTVNTPSLAK